MGLLHFLKKGNQSKAEKHPTRTEKDRWPSAYEIADQLGLRGYQFQYFDVCQNIWKTRVPRSGQASTLQGEMLRQAEKLRNEARDNGNLNWDDDFSWFCDFLKETFKESGVFEQDQLNQLLTVLETIKKTGEYAADFNTGHIPEEEVDPDKIAYVEDDLYNFIEDGIALFSMKNPEDIPYEENEFIHR